MHGEGFQKDRASTSNGQSFVFYRRQELSTTCNVLARTIDLPPTLPSNENSQIYSLILKCLSLPSSTLLLPHIFFVPLTLFPALCRPLSSSYSACSNLCFFGLSFYTSVSLRLPLTVLIVDSSPTSIRYNSNANFPIIETVRLL